jgi:hypothetical protein
MYLPLGLLLFTNGKQKITMRRDLFVEKIVSNI